MNGFSIIQMKPPDWWCRSAEITWFSIHHLFWISRSWWGILTVHFEAHNEILAPPYITIWDTLGTLFLIIIMLQYLFSTYLSKNVHITYNNTSNLWNFQLSLTPFAQKSMVFICNTPNINENYTHFLPLSSQTHMHPSPVP